MKKILMILAVCFLSTNLFAKTVYIYTNNRFDYVKLVDIKKKDIAEYKLSQPISVPEENLAAMLKAVKLSKSFLVKKETETQDVFDENAVRFLAPKFVDALAQATNGQKIAFSYLTKDPKFVLRNDRVTIGNAWVSEGELHIEFEKLMAKLNGDYDKRGDYSKIIAAARGLRMSLEIRDGQKYGANMSEVVIAMDHDFNKPATMVNDEEVTGKEETYVATKKSPDTQQPRTTKERLKELESLKDDGLITDKEYKVKKKEILKGL